MRCCTSDVLDSRIVLHEHSVVTKYATCKDQAQKGMVKNMTRTQIENVVYKAIAEAFLLDEETVRKETQKALREDLGASSMQYLPLITTIEEELGVDIDLHGFQNDARTIGGVVNYVEAVCKEQGL